MATGRMSPGRLWAHIAAGGGHTCGIRADGTLWCWGANDFGQLGLGNHLSQDRPRQVTTPAAGGWASITAGGVHTCATRTNGTLWCWGWNRAGQLGLGSHTDQDLPRQVTTPAVGGWASVSAGSVHTCAARTDHTVWCWGSNYYSQLGNGTHTDSSVPVQEHTHARDWAAVTTSDGHTCAIKTSHTLWCWGDNFDGELGDGTTTDSTVPVQEHTHARDGASVSAGGVISRPPWALSG